MEKQNKAARQRRKKEEVARIRTLVGITPYMDVCVFISPLTWLCVSRGSLYLRMCLRVVMCVFVCILHELCIENASHCCRVYCVCVMPADNAYACDPRVRRYKEAEKAEKLAKRRARDEATRQEILDKEKARGFMVL